MITKVFAPSTLDEFLHHARTCAVGDRVNLKGFLWELVEGGKWKCLGSVDGSPLAKWAKNKPAPDAIDQFAFESCARFFPEIAPEPIGFGTEPLSKSAAKKAKKPWLPTKSQAHSRSLVQHGNCFDFMHGWRLDVAPDGRITGDREPMRLSKSGDGRSFSTSGTISIIE